MIDDGGVVLSRQSSSQRPRHCQFGLLPYFGALHLCLGLFKQEALHFKLQLLINCNDYCYAAGCT
jgi:hypothetical protein